MQGPETALDELLRSAIKGTGRSKVISVQKELREPEVDLGDFVIIS